MNNTELFLRNCKYGGLVWYAAYLAHNVITISEQLTNTAILIKEISGESLSLIDSTNCIKRVILCWRSNDIEYITKEVPNNFDGQSEAYLKKHSTRFCDSFCVK
jgi:hypothetical protein